MKKLEDSLSKLTKNISQTKDIRIFKIYQNWENVVGKEIAAKVTPYKISGSKGRTKLTILLNENMDFFMCQSLKMEVLEKLNSFFGKNYIDTVVILLDE